MKLFHGTTLNRFLEILKTGYLGTDKPIWNVSEKDTTYFYGEDKLKKDYEENWYDEGIREALSNAEISLIGENTNLKRVILILDSEDLENLGKLEDDGSCVGMDSYQFKEKIPIELIKEIYVDKENLDIYLLYFLGLSKTLLDRRNGVNLSYDLENKIYSYPSEVLEAAAKVYETLAEFIMDNLENIEVLEQKKIEDFRPGVKE